MILKQTSDKLMSCLEWIYNKYGICRGCVVFLILCVAALSALGGMLVLIVGLVTNYG